MEKPLRILAIFNDFFGEERVDMQGFCTLDEVKQQLSSNASISAIKELIPLTGYILVHFPHVRITNEFDKYTDIDDLYAKVTFDINGKIIGKFMLNRATYSMLHIVNGYMHSHISTIPFNDFEEFQLPCTGTGPINNTICSLARDFDESLWNLFCLELDRYVQVESIAGTPYHRLESLSMSRRDGTYEDRVSSRVSFSLYSPTLSSYRRVLSSGKMAEFIKYVIDNKILHFTYSKTKGYIPAMGTTELYIKLSNAFIKWYNKEYAHNRVTTLLQDIIASGLLHRCLYQYGKFFRENYDTSTARYMAFIGRKVCTFKGNDILLNIIDIPEEPDSEENNRILILGEDFVKYILTKIFNVINFEYGRKRMADNTPRKKVCFI